ncbi:class I SAM-dependent methyltransferase [Palleronia abyssalis]|uniref:Methyltransferase domain-containing protein n=1 Tax=Palleronia abyssalis TaxID=1501240 RepID=A0A2R8BZG1_9RHOB|nr:methyltransferase domain-containing protein [Palleronia abyssalis]SPJ25486.1 hypothetical protein PAA8504_03337 [Palleronia abyssalis]
MTPPLPRLSAADAETRRARFLPFVLPWREIDLLPRALDLDCGAGGWLQLLSAAGFDVEGSEIDPTLREEAQNAGFAVAEDMSFHLSELTEGSLAVLSGFEVLTRHDPAGIDALLPHMLRVLRPGGLLILGGADVEHPDAPPARTRATDLFERLRAENPGRLKIVRSGSLADDPWGTSPANVTLVLQTDAKGAAFDRFHAAFAAAPSLEDLHPTRFDAYLLDRLSQLDAIHMSTRQAAEERTLRLERRVTELEALQAAQRQEIESLRHLTRRRGLRKWLHDRRAGRKTDPDAADADAPGTDLPAVSPLSVPERPSPSAPLQPLSTRMQALRERLAE